MANEIPEAIGTYEVGFYAVCWVIASVCGILSTFVGARYGGVWDIFATGAIAGFVGVSVIAVYLRVVGGGFGSEPFYQLAIAVACGLMGKSSIKLIYVIQNVVFSKIGIDSNDVRALPDEQTTKNRSGDSSDRPD